jgi:hypothetical protein
VGIGALSAQYRNGRWKVSALGAPYIGERSEKKIISAFVNRIADLSPQLVTFNSALEHGPNLPAVFDGLRKAGLDSGAKRNAVKKNGFERLFLARQSRLGMAS